MIHVEVPSIVIAAPPALVREVILDFEAIPQWHKGHFRSITPPTGKKGQDIVTGDKLQVVLDHGKNGFAFSPVVKENSETRLRWLGSLPGVFSGDHVFEFHPLPDDPTQTNFIHYEDFSGMLSFTMEAKKKSGVMNMEGFQAFNRDLKAKCEADLPDYKA